MLSKKATPEIVALIDKCVQPRTDYLRLERTIFAFLFLTVLFLPHSIAASQTAWILGMFFLLIRLLLKPKIQKTPLDRPLWLFFLWSLITCFFSYTPLISLDKMRSVAVFLIFYFVVNVIRSNSTAVLLTFALIFSCMINVFYVPIERIIGRGVEVQGLHPDSPLSKALLMNGDTLLKANEKKIYSPEDLIEEIEKQDSTKILFYRPDFYYTVEVKRNDLLDGKNALEKLGIQSWKKSHNWRSTGFYGHWTTYADVLQLIASLILGIIISLANRIKIFSISRQKILLQQSLKKNNTPEKKQDETSTSSEQAVTLKPEIKSSLPIFLQSSLSNRSFWLFVTVFPFAMMLLALILSGTRAPLVGLLLSAIVIVLLNGNHKMLCFSASLGFLVILLGSIYLQQSRHVGFIDESDDSTKYRQIVYREAIGLWMKQPRHILFGVGMDSIKVYAPEWKLFDNGRLPMGHFHSVPLQLLVERGLPALLIWCWIIFVYAKLLLEAISKSHEILQKGVLLGIFGGMVGFLTSGMVHYNLGDQEVAMVFFFLMGIAWILISHENSSS
jgi:hypothetical protein